MENKEKIKYVKDFELDITNGTNNNMMNQGTKINIKI